MEEEDWLRLRLKSSHDELLQHVLGVCWDGVGRWEEEEEDSAQIMRIIQETYECDVSRWGLLASIISLFQKLLYIHTLLPPRSSGRY